jgi:hypothetical protein
MGVCGWMGIEMMEIAARCAVVSYAVDMLPLKLRV